MKGKYTLFLALLVIAGCSKEDSGTSDREIVDSTRLVSSYEGLEKQIRDYYDSIEEDVRKDLGVSEDEIVERVQTMIDDGFVKQPAILVVTESGAQWKVVDYATYKEYMASNATVLRRYYGVQPNVLDTVSMDSIRSNVLDALSSKSKVDRP